MTVEPLIPCAVIAEAAAMEGGVPVLGIMSSRRDVEIVRIRFAAILVTRRLRPDLSLPQIARAYKRTDHSTVLHALTRADQMEASSDEFRCLVAAIHRRAVAGDVNAAPQPREMPPEDFHERLQAYRLPRAKHAPDDPPETREIRTAGQHGTDRMLARLVLLSQMEAAE